MQRCVSITSTFEQTHVIIPPVAIRQRFEEMVSMPFEKELANPIKT
jgi:hypothetical protein